MHIPASHELRCCTKQVINMHIEPQIRTRRVWIGGKLPASYGLQHQLPGCRLFAGTFYGKATVSRQLLTCSRFLACRSTGALRACARPLPQSLKVAVHFLARFVQHLLVVLKYVLDSTSSLMHNLHRCGGMYYIILQSSLEKRLAC